MVLVVALVGAFWLGFIWVTLADREDAMDDAGDSLRAFAESYAEFAVVLAKSGHDLPWGERVLGATDSRTPTAIALDKFHAAAQPDEGVKITIRRLAPGTEDTPSNYSANDLRPYTYAGDRLLVAAPRPEAGIEIVAEENAFANAYQSWREAVQVEVVVLGVLTLLIGWLLAWFLRHMRAHEAMEAQNAKLQSELRQADKLQAIGTLAGGVAHELNNLLQPIIMTTELILIDLPEDHSNVVQLNRVVDAGTKAAEIVQRILAFGRADEASHTMLDLSFVVREATSFVRTILPSTITLRIEIEDSVGGVRGDKTQLTQVLINLVTNARDAIGPNVGAIWVKLSRASISTEGSAGLLKPGVYAVLNVKDTGAGMDKETAQRIFEPFFTTKGVGKGTGLGLSVSHGIVTAHGGAIGVDSAPGHGADFSIYLPIAA